MPTKVHLVKALVFPVVMYGYENWTIKKAERQELTLLNSGIGGDIRESLGLQERPNHSIQMEINHEYSLEGLMLKLKRQYFGHLMQRTDSLEKTLMQGMIEGGREGDDRG